MGTLSDYQSEDTLARSRRGTTNRSLGSTPVAATTPKKENLGLPGVAQKFKDFGRQTGNAAEFITAKTAGFVKNSIVDIAKAGIGTAKTIRDAQVQPYQNKVYADIGRQLEAKQSTVLQDYKSGRMSREDFLKTSEDLNKAFNELNKETMKISAGPTPVQRATEVAETAINALSLGSLTSVKTGGEQVAKEGLEGLIQKGVFGLDDLITKVPAARELIERNTATLAKREAQKLAGETLEEYLYREGKSVASGLLIKRPLFYQSNIGGAQEIYNKILKDKDYAGAGWSAAWLATQMIGGGPLGGAIKLGGDIKSKVKALATGKGSVLDELSKRIGTGSSAQGARYFSKLSQKAPNAFAEDEKAARIIFETNLRMSGDDAGQAAEKILTHYEQHGYDLRNVTIPQIVADAKRWVQADEVGQRVAKLIDSENADKYVVVRWDKVAKEGLASTLVKAGNDYQARVAALYEMADRPGIGWGNNPILMKKLEKAIQNPDAKAMVDEIRAISTVGTIAKEVPAKQAKELADLGYSLAIPFGGRKIQAIDYNDTRKLVTAAIKGDTEIFDVAKAPQPEISAIASTLRRFGLSPESANEVGRQKLSQSLVANLDQTKIGKELGLGSINDDTTAGGRAILSKLQEYIEKKRPNRIGKLATLGRADSSAITDIRMLYTDEIQDALNISEDAAKSVSKAITEAYMKVPLEFRGIGNKVTDALYRYNPAQKYYSRIQSALRYTYNPFFRAQERVETALLSRAKGHNLVWMKKRSELNEAVKILEDRGIFSKTPSSLGEAAEDIALRGRITATLTSGQKRDLAGLAGKIAESKGMTLERMASEFPDEIDDALRVVVQYPNKGIINSPLARTINLAFFPMRYNAKVTGVIAKELAKAPPSVQLATINGMFEMKNWLRSDEGIAWQAQHADAIQVLKWITPINSIESTMKLLSGDIHSAGDLGLLGGLPLGFITQILDGQGIININKPYVNPKTGEVIPDYIPKTTRARASVAITDLLSSMFTFPGRILGLPGKEATLRDVVKSFIKTNGKDFDKQLNTEELTPLQKNWVRVLKGDTSEEAIDSLYQSPAEGAYRGYTLPPLDLPIRTPENSPAVERRTGLPRKQAKARAAKAPKKTASPIAAQL